LVLKGPQTIDDSLYQNVYQPFKSAVLHQPGIESIASSSSVPGNEIYWTNSWKRYDDQQSTDVTLYNLGVDYDFVPSYKIKLVAGRNFSEQFGTDKKTVLFNENAVKLLGFKDAASAINQKVVNGSRDTLTIVGVTANFHQLGLQKNIDPMVIRLRPNASAFYSLKLNSSNAQQTIASLKTTWSNYFPKDPFDYFFLDESFGDQYKADLLFGKVFGVFAFLAILIACFGLLGLSAYNVLQRTKEIGIRKVLGASVQSILVLLSLDFLKLILISFLFAIPAGWFIMNLWLRDYAYRINIAWWVFGIAGCVALLIAIITVSTQAIKAALSNPVKSLRME
ncbi:MAG TPA: FtsX-like permease family protein, partial [Parafilimonas sp.]